eukprot:c26758_g1_i1 orf=106-333(-)
MSTIVPGGTNSRNQSGQPSDAQHISIPGISTQQHSGMQQDPSTSAAGMQQDQYTSAQLECRHVEWNWSLKLALTP